MWQSIITVIIIAIAIFFAVRPYFRKKEGTGHECKGCSSSCGDCPVMDIKAQIESGRKNQAANPSHHD